MKAFFFILIVHIIIVLIPRRTAEVNNENSIDFWTNSFDEIIFQFRYNSDTNQLEMQQEQGCKGSVLATGKDFGKSSPEVEDTPPQKTNPLRRQRHINPKREEPRKNRALQLKRDVNTRIAIRSSEKTEPDGSHDTTVETLTPTSTTMNPLSVEACARNCPNEPHIACGNSWTLSQNCSSTTRVFNLNSHQQELLLHLHNDLRNKLAGNLTDKFESARHMATLQWHSELAEYASLNAMKCDDEHDWCHSTNEFQRPGQNLAWKMWTSRRTSVETILERMVNDWYNEEQFTRQSDLDSYQGEGVDNNVISHFTTIVNERNTHMGCGAIHTHEGKKKTLFLACNYARNNVLNQPIYVKGPTASLCSTGINPHYTNLCSIDEVYDYNN